MIESYRLEQSANLLVTELKLATKLELSLELIWTTFKCWLANFSELSAAGQRDLRLGRETYRSASLLRGG